MRESKSWKVLGTKLAKHEGKWKRQPKRRRTITHGNNEDRNSWGFIFNTII